MAEDVGQPGYAQQKSLHPFFAHTRSAATASPELPSNNDTRSTTPGGDSDEWSGNDAAGKACNGRSKRRKLESDALGDEEQGHKRRTRKRTRTSPRRSIANHFIRLDKTGNESSADESGVTRTRDARRHERELLTEVGSDAVLPDVSRADDALEETQDASRDKQQAEEQSQAKHSQPPLPESSVDAGQPRKMLQFNPKTGTIGSPPKAKVWKTDDDKTALDGRRVSTRGRPRKVLSMVVRIKYGASPESRMRVGARIQAILDGDTPSAKPEAPLPQADRQDVKSSERLEGDAKPAPANLHPLFCKPKPSSVATTEPQSDQSKPAGLEKTKKSVVTSCLPRRVDPHPLSSNARLPQFGMRNSGLKFPGSRLPAWPWKGMVHVRDDTDYTDYPQRDADALARVSPPRKSKGRAVKLGETESVMKIAAERLCLPAAVEALSKASVDELSPPPRELRLPQKHLESGKKLQNRVYPQLRTRTASPVGQIKAKSKIKQKIDKSEPRPGTSNDPPANLPPSLVRLFDSIGTNLSAFDRSECETASWAQKYTPTAAVEVLQPGREAFFLRDWLQALMVQAVDTGSSDVDKAKGGSSKARSSSVARKRKRRSKKLDDFIVLSEDDETTELELDSDMEQDWTPSGKSGVSKPTVIRTKDVAAGGRDGARLMNTVVISGPQGCGKTAAVYAVAKELGFEVFEINPSSRRSGKDVLEKIGDMTRNHLVKHHGQPSSQGEDGTAVPAVPAVPAEDVADKETKTGKQATMNSFFKAKPEAAASKPKKQKQSKPVANGAEAPKEPPKSQKQSLILLDEVDILYEEDRQFWSTVLGLMAQSKRPFVVTCNDETLVPLQSLSLHGIFRFSPPPTDLAVDRLLLIAANEGHALKREAVEALYESRNRDLRAATMDLNYWCQIGVGDRRGGFDWFYLRWPKGIDRDENGDVVRVVSEGTYQLGMDWLGRDRLVDDSASAGEVERELLLQAWDSWQLDLGDWEDSDRVLMSWAEGAQAVTATPPGRLGALEAYEVLAESMSMADICSCGSLAGLREEPLDATLPEISAKSREDFITGLQLLDARPLVYYNTLIPAVPFAIKSLARDCLQASLGGLQQHGATEFSLSALDESRAVSAIRARLSSSPPDSPVVSRIDFALAFDCIAASDSVISPAAGSHLEPSVFDRTLELVVLDVAPYVRSIVAYESRLQDQRLKLSTLVSEGGRGSKGAKRMRTTRAALSALEGGSRSTTRGERWFKADMNAYLVMRTSGATWDDFALAESSTHRSLPSPTRRRTGFQSRQAVVEEDSPGNTTDGNE